MGIFDKLTERVGDFIEEVMIPDELHLQLERAERDIQQGDFDRALSTLERVARAKPELARAHHLIGRAQFLRGAPQEAARAFRRAIELKEEPLSHFWAGLCMERLEQWRAAEEHLRRAALLGADRANIELEVYLGLGRVALEQGRADKAIKELRRALKLAPDHVTASVTLARALLARDQAQEAWELLTRVEHNLAGAQAWLIQAQVAKATDRTTRAIEACELLLADEDARHDQRRKALMMALELSLKQYQWERAAHWLAQLEALDRHELDAPALVLKARYEQAKGDPSQVERLLNLATARDPQHTPALIMLGQLMLERDELEHAQLYFQRALDTESSAHDGQALLGLGWCRLKRDELTGARQLIDEALRHDDPQLKRRAALALAEIELRQGDAARALVAAKNALTYPAAHQQDDAARIDALMQRAIDALKPDWSDLPTALDDTISVHNVMIALRDYIARDHKLVDFLPTVQEQLRTLDSPLSIAIVGEFNAGKSTLINALLQEDLVPVGVLPTTAHTGIIQYGPRSSAHVHFTDGSAKEVSFDEAKRLMKTNADEIAYLDYFYPHPELRAVHFWDTPGFNALEERHEVVAARALERAEAILWVMDANQVLSQTEFERIESVQDGDERLLVVINKIDRLGPKSFRQDSVDELVEYIEDYAGEHVAGCYPISALQALERAKATSRGLTPEEEAALGEDESGMSEFRQHLQRQLFERAGHIKTLEAKRHLGGLVITLSAFQHGLTQRYHKLAQSAALADADIQRQRASTCEQRAGQELMTLEDRLDFMLRAIVKEVEEAIKPTNTLINTRHHLSDEDRQYTQQLLLERFISLLDQSLERVFYDAVSLEAQIAQRLGPLLYELSLSDARALSQRLEGFRDEIRVLKLLLKERVYGRLIAKATGQIEAGSQATLRAVEAVGQDPTRWRALLRALLPELRPHFKQDLAQWYQDFFTASSRLFERVSADLEVLELEAKHRYNTAPLEALILGEPLDLSAPADDVEGEDALED